MIQNCRKALFWLLLVLFCVSLSGCSSRDDSLTDTLKSGLYKSYTGQKMTPIERSTVNSYRKWELTH